jgi:hypothetical protein
MTIQTPKETKAFRIALTPKEAHGVRNCRASLWQGYAGALCRKHGHELPESHTADVVGHELVISAR